MVTAKGKIESQEYNNSNTVKGNNSVWFLNNDLVRVHHHTRSTGMVALYNLTKDRIEVCFTNDFKKIENAKLIENKINELKTDVIKNINDEEENDIK